MMIRRQELQVDPGEARTDLQTAIRSIFDGRTFHLVPFAGGPYLETNDSVCKAFRPKNAIRTPRVQEP